MPASITIIFGLCSYLVDAGYFELELFAAIDDREGSFLGKAPQGINPLILSAWI